MTFTITVKNTGNVTLTKPAAKVAFIQGGDTLAGISGPTLTSGDTDTDNALDVGETWIYIATLGVDQQNIDFPGSITASVTFDTEETDGEYVTATATIGQAAGFDLKANVDPKSLSAPGKLTYTFTVVNTGNVTLTGLLLTSQLTQGNNVLTLTTEPALREGDSDNDGVFDVGETWKYEATFEAKESDIAKGGEIKGTVIFDTAETDSNTAAATTGINIAAVAIGNMVNEPDYDAVNDVLTYQITITNEGSVPLTGIKVSDDLPGNGDVSCPGSTLAANAAMECTASYPVKQSDIDAGSVTSTASVVSNETPTAMTATATSTAKQSEGLSVKISSSSKYSQAGDALEYSFVVSNTGNTTLANLVLEAPLISNGSITGCGLQALAPAAKVTCVAQYTVTQADVAAGQVVNEATARAIGPAGAGEIVAKNTLTISVSTGPTDEEVQKSFENLTGVFLAQRADRILQNEPRAYGLRGRASGEGQAGLVANLQGAGSAIDGSFSASLQGMRVRALALAGEGLPDPEDRNWIDRFDIWVEGSFNSYSDPDEDDDRKGQFGIVHTGVDYRISQDVLLGILASVDWTKEKTDVVDGEVDGTGWMVGPYMSARLSEHIYFDARIGWGRSDNSARQSIMGFEYEGDFKTERWLARATLAGAWNFDNLVLSPEISVAYIEDKQDAYDVNGNGGTVAVDGQTISVGRLSIAQEIGYRYELETASLLPYLRAGLHWDFDQAETFVLLDDRVALDELRGPGEIGIRVQSDSGVNGNLGVTYDGLFSNNLQAFGVKGEIAVQF